MKKRILSFMMVVALFLTLVVPVSSVEAPTIILTNSVTDVQRGAIVEIKIDIRNNPGISSLSVKLNYDTSILHLERISKGELFDSVTSNTSTGRIVCDSGEDVCEDGTLATAYFKVLEDAAPSEYVINATVVSCNNFDEQRVSCSTVPASVTVACNHVYSAWENSDSNTHKCTCSICGKVETAAHSWDAGKMTTEPTHLTEGVKTYICTVCGATKIEKTDPTPEHSFGVWEKHNETQHKHTCACGAVEYENHKWNEGVVTKAPTCKDTGIKTYTCTVCGETKTETLPLIDTHTWGEWTKDTADEHKRICSICGKSETAAHSWDEGKVTTEPTHLDTGIKTYTCTVCGETKTEMLPIIDTHTWGEWTKDTAEAHKRTCSICGKVETAAHSWDEGKVTTEPTHLTEGVKTYICTVCGETRTEVIAQLPITEDTPCVLIGTGTAVAGDTVQIIISLKNNPGFIGMNMHLIYSEELTLLQAVNKADNLTFTMDKTLVWDGGENYAQDGDLLILTFKVNDDAKSGDYEINLVINEAFNNEDQDVFFYTIQGMIHVVDCVYGDANGDGVINTKDIVLVRKYVAGKDPVTGVSNIEVTPGADVNGDGVVNTRDVVLLRKYVAGVDPSTGKSDVVLGPTK